MKGHICDGIVDNIDSRVDAQDPVLIRLWGACLRSQVSRCGSGYNNIQTVNDNLSKAQTTMHVLQASINNLQGRLDKIESSMLNAQQIRRIAREQAQMTYYKHLYQIDKGSGK